MAESFENLDNILRDYDKVQKRLEHWTGMMRCSTKKEKSVPFLENNSEKILELSHSTVERD